MKRFSFDDFFFISLIDVVCFAVITRLIVCVCVCACVCVCVCVCVKEEVILLRLHTHMISIE